EATSLFRQRKELRRFRGAGSSEREAVLLRIRDELGRRWTSASLGKGWENHDLRVNGALWAEGRLYSSPDDYDQALCVGFRAYTTRSMRFALAVLAFLCAWAIAQDFRLLALAVLRLALFWLVLDERARLRQSSWEAVEASFASRGAHAAAHAHSGAHARHQRVTRHMDGVEGLESPDLQGSGS